MIQTWSKFNYGFDVDSENQYLDIIESGIFPQTAATEFGNYTLGEGLRAVQDAMNTVARNAYVITVDRTTNLVTITGTEVFELPLVNGPTAASSIFYLLGFRQGADLSGSAAYTGSHPCGFAYTPQFKLQSYLPPEHFIESSDATVNKSADGRVEVVRFGLEQKMEMDIKFITNLKMDDTVIRNSQTGVADALAFLAYISQKKRFEFMPDENDSGTYYKVILESLPGFGKGTGFRLKELFGQGQPDLYETGIMQLRVVQ